MLIYDIDYVDVEKEIAVYIKWELKNFNFQKIFLNWNISFNKRGKLMKIGMCVVDTHSEGTVSHNFYLGPSFYFMKCRKFSCKKW